MNEAWTSSLDIQLTYSKETPFVGTPRKIFVKYCVKPRYCIYVFGFLEIILQSFIECPFIYIYIYIYI